jgi:hypothetical protein
VLGVRTESSGCWRGEEDWVGNRVEFPGQMLVSQLGDRARKSDLRVDPVQGAGEV